MKMYIMENNLKYIYVFILLLLLGSCGKNKDISEFTVYPPCQYKVEYMGDTIKIRDLLAAKSSGLDNPAIWVKKNGKYYSVYGFLMMSTEKDTSYVFPTKDLIIPMKQIAVIRKIGKNLYSNREYWELAPNRRELVYAVFYDKSYRIKKVQIMLPCDFVLKK